MNTLARGLIVGAVQLLLVSSVGAKFLYDRANYARLWVESAPYDPYLPIRGRYVSIALLVDAERAESSIGSGTGPAMFLARLESRAGRLVAIEDHDGRHWVTSRDCGARKCWQLTAPLAFFIPEHGVDPSRRPAGETLWVEVTLPPTGAPRPLRLGVKEGEELVPLDQ
ncbi:MAG: hypothetical protein ACRES3_03595 [Steroidobacteraceae bacterium]